VNTLHQQCQMRTSLCNPGYLSYMLDFLSQNAHCARKVIRFDDCTFRRGYLHVLLGRLRIKELDNVAGKEGELVLEAAYLSTGRSYSKFKRYHL
jgi:hypothetical protein